MCVKGVTCSGTPTKNYQLTAVPLSSTVFFGSLFWLYGYHHLLFWFTDASLIASSRTHCALAVQHETAGKVTVATRW